MSAMKTLLRIACLAAVLGAAAPVSAALSNDDCLGCHADSETFPAGAFDASTHSFLSCTDCHADLAEAEIPHADEAAPVDCATCHADAVAAYTKGIHATARANGQRFAAKCVDCHGVHDIRGKDDPASRVYHQNLPNTCGTCHGDAALIDEAGIRIGDVAKAFHDSIHGVALEKKGLVVAPNCSDCHRAHDILRASEAESPVNRANIPKTCGACHVGIVAPYAKSVHGMAVAAGNGGAPTCADCHTAHSIGHVETAGWQLEVLSECGSCHAESLRTYRDTFHGQVTALGFTRVATCSGCHGAHDILPSADPASRISGEGRVATCRKCHPGANARFAGYDPHADKRDYDRNPWLYLSAKFMHFLLIGVFLFFGTHSALWFGRSLVEVRAKRRRGKEG